MLAAAALCALVIGVVLGLLGGGGSILTVPVLLYVVHLPAKEALATSLLVVSIGSLSALSTHARARRVDFRTGILFGLSSTVGAYVGGRLAHHLPSRLLLVALALLMVTSAAGMLRSRPESDTPVPPRPLLMPPLGFVTGTVAALLGAGGGFLIVPVLSLLGGLAMPQAVGTSLLIMAMQSLAGALGYLAHAPVNLRVLAVMAAGASAGSLVGSHLAGRVPAGILRRLFGGLIFLTAVFMLLKNLP